MKNLIEIDILYIVPPHDVYVDGNSTDDCW